MLTDLLFFLFAGATLSLLIWSGAELFRNQEDPLGDRLEGLQSQAMVVAARAERRKRAGRGLDRFLYWWPVPRRRRLDARHREAAATGRRAPQTGAGGLHDPGDPAGALADGRLALPAAQQPCDVADRGMVAVLILGFMLPKQVLYRMVKRYRRKLQEALPDTVDLLGIVLRNRPQPGPGHDARERGDAVHLPELADEFATVVMQVRAGQERGTAFKQFVRRTGIEDIKSLAAMIIQSEKFGTSLAQALKVYADALRTRAVCGAEAAWAKPASSAVPIVLFILPVLFVVTAVPRHVSVLKRFEAAGRGEDRGPCPRRGSFRRR